MSDEYLKQAKKFCKKNNVKMEVIGEPVYDKYFDDDKESRYIFTIKLSRNDESYTFTFGQSIAAGNKKPNVYDVLACLTKYDPESFEDFCSEFGYTVYEDDFDGDGEYDLDDYYNRKSMKIYNAVCDEYENVERLFGDVIDELSEIA